MEPNEVRLDIEGPQGQIDPRALTEGLDHLLKLLESLQPTAYASETAAVWEVSDLQLGSFKVGVRGNADIASIATHGLEDLAERPGVPQGWSYESVRQVIALGKVRRKRGVDELQIALSKTMAAIDETLVHNAEQSLKPWPDSIGSVQGRLFRYNDTSGSAGLTDEITRQTVEIKVPTEHRQQVARALTSDVCVWGIMHHAADGRIAHVSLEGIEVLPEPGPPAQISELADILGSDWTGGIDAVEAVRRQRD